MNESASTSSPAPVRVRTVFWAFLRLGATAFGGPAMVAYMKVLTVEKNAWLSDSVFRNGVGLCQTIPGATAMQMAAYCGFRAAGLLGAAATYIGFGLPAFVLMVCAAAAYSHVQQLPVTVSLFTGLRVIVVAIVANASVHFAKTSLKDWKDAGLAVAVAAFLGVGGHPIIAVVAAAGIALLLHRNAPLDAHANSTAPHSAQNAARRPWLAPLLMALALALAMALLFLLNRELCVLGWVMLRIDLFAFGGGFASIPLMLHEIVDARHWLDGKTFMDGIALGQVTPGPIVITSTFVGYQIAGFPGAVVATICIFAPSFIVLVLSVPYLDQLQSSSVARRALHGAQVSFVGLLFAVTVRFALAAPWSIASATIGLLTLAALLRKIDLLWVVLAGGAISAFVL